MAFSKTKKPAEKAADLPETEANAPEEMPAAETPAEEALDETAQLLKAAQDKAEEYLQMAQRVQADFENYRKRTKATRAEAFEDGAREIVKQLLPVVDNLERALAQESADEALLQGVKLVYRQMMDALEKRGVSEISRAGEKFDPNLENAVMQADASEGEPGTVCAVLQKGYKMGEYVLRHAMVKFVAE